MNFTFYNPLILFGLAAMVLPILIHRITQKKAVVLKFSAVRLLLQSQHISARPQRLKNLLILALRLLAVTTIVVMMARPIFSRAGFAALQREGAKVLIVDNSLSMAYQEERGQRFDLAKSAAKEVLEGFEGRVAVIPTVSTFNDRGNRWVKPGEALRELEALPLTSERGKTVNAFAAAHLELKDLKVPKQILMFSDLARGDWEGFGLEKTGITSEADVTFFRMGGSGRDANSCIKGVSLVEGDIVAGIPALLEVTISNLSDQSEALLVYLSLSGVKVDQKAIDLKPGQDGKLLFNLLVENPGWVDGEVKLSPDRLNADDVFYFPLKVKEKIKVLVVDGDPKTSLKAGESYYLVNALHPGGLEASPFQTRVITMSEMDRVDLRIYDALFLLNVARPDLSRVAFFLEMGKPTFIFFGDQIVPEVYNRFSLASWQIGEVIDLSRNTERTVVIEAGIGEQLQFLKQLEPNLGGAFFHKYFSVAGAAKKLVALKNGDPLLLMADAGKSKIYLFVSSADLEWNDLPLKAAFLPLIQELVKGAVGLTETSLPPGIRVGDSVGAEGDPFQIKGTSGGAGIFQYRLSSGPLRRGVNTPYEESDLAKISTDELKKKFVAGDINVVEYKAGGLKNQRGGRKELWPLLLGFLLAVLAAETLLANGLVRIKKIRNSLQVK